MKIEEFDRQLINLLSQNALQTSKALGKQLNVDGSTVRRRLKRLVREGVIRIVARPEPKKTGFPLESIIAFDVASEHLDSVMNTLSNRPEVRWLAATTGRFDVMAMAWFSSTEELYYFLEREVSKLEGVRHTETFVSLHAGKRFGLKSPS